MNFDRFQPPKDDDKPAMIVCDKCGKIYEPEDEIQDGDEAICPKCEMWEEKE